jgi:hypothetical protein
MLFPPDPHPYQKERAAGRTCDEPRPLQRGLFMMEMQGAREVTPRVEEQGHGPAALRLLEGHRRGWER